jgi:hypothetical protein
VPAQPIREERAPNPWPAISEQFALRILAGAYQMSGHLQSVEADERDPDRLEKLYRIDHANARMRRHAENLQVLAGRHVDDAGRQMTSLLDVIRAATSAIEHYPRVQIGHVAGLAVVEFAADDVIRMLTELLDNATRFSPPTSKVIASAHLTERGSVLLRVEDAGVGIPPEQLASLNAMLADGAPALLRAEPALHLGLAVVQRLAVTHHMRVHLNHRQPAGTTATVLVPEGLLSEGPLGEVSHGSMPLTAPPPPAPPRSDQRPLDVTYLAAAGSRTASGRADRRPLPRVNGQAAGGHTPPTNGHGMIPGARAPEPPEEAPRRGESSSGLPVRVPSSIRDEEPTPAPAPEPSPVPGRHQWPDETADFAAGISDARATSDSSPEGQA